MMMVPPPPSPPGSTPPPAASLPATMPAADFLRRMERAGWRVRACRHSRHGLVHAATGRLLDVAFHKRLSRSTVERVLARAQQGRLPHTGMP